MDTLQAIVLGIVQGLTEFLPISSTGHLRIVPAFLGWDDPGSAFTAVTQLGTMAAVLIFFRATLVGVPPRLAARPARARSRDARPRACSAGGSCSAPCRSRSSACSSAT